MPGLLYLFVLVTILVVLLFLRDRGGNTVLILGGAAIIHVLAGMFYFLLKIYHPLTSIRKKMDGMAHGEFAEEQSDFSSFEFKEIERLRKQHQARLMEIVGMAENLAEGKIEEGFRSLGDHDALGNSLLSLKESMVKANKETRRRRQEDEQQKWASQGLAKFGDLLRDFDQRIVPLSNEFMRELVAYLDVEVGGIFLREYTAEGDVNFVLKGAYAFDREKQLHQSFLPGEGLVGRCVIEKESILITDVPEDYIRIRSGLGEDRPSSILLVPVMFNDEVIGVIEIASFVPVPDYKVHFLESLGTSISSSLSKAVSI